MDRQTNAMDRQASSGRSWWLWVAVAFCAFHIVEEYAFDWPASARQLFHVATGWNDYFVVNGVFLIFGIAGAMIAWRLVVFSLAFPALLFWNAIFHTVASLFAQKLNPGTITALILLAPIGIVCFVVAYKDGVMTRNRALAAMALGAAVHAFPFLAILLRPLLSY